MKNPAASQSALAATVLASLAAAGLGTSNLFAQTSGEWSLNNNGNWSDPVNWLDGDLADGAGATADFSKLNISANRTVTIDGAIASRTLGALFLGDSDGTHGYTIAANGSGTLTFNNNGSAANLTQGPVSSANIISAPVLLADSLNISNNSAGNLTISGTVSDSTAGAKTITNQGSGTGSVIFSGVISDSTGTVAVVQNSATSSLTLSGANTFATNVLIKQGTLVSGNAAALGTGALLLGDTTGSASATYAISTGNAVSHTNAITVQAGTTGKLTLTHSGAGASARANGNILLNNHLTLEVSGSNRAGSNLGAFLATGGVISGTGNLNLEVNGGLYTSNNSGAPQGDSLSVGGSVTTSGSINNVGSGEGKAIITGNITNASSVNQNSASSMLTLSGTNTYAGATNVNAGVLRINATASLPVASTTTVASGATLQLGTSVNINANQALTLSGHGAYYSSGALESTNTATYASAITLAADTTIGSTLTNTNLTLSGPITGSGRNLTTTGAGNHLISGAIGTGSGGLIKEGSGLTTLSGANTYTGLTQINAGVLALGHASALGGGGSITFGGGTLRLSSTNEADLGSRISGSASAVAIDTNSRNVSYSGIDATNTGGLFKTGAGRLTLSGTNTFTGPIVVNNGALAISTTAALPAIGTGQIFIDGNGALNTGGAYATVQDWLNSANIATTSTGVIALTGNSSENIDFTGYSGLGLGASSNATYTGSITPAGSTYRLGGGGATLTLSGVNALTGVGTLVVNGSVVLSAANDLAGETTISSGTLTLGTGGTLAGSTVTIGSGATLALTTATSGSAVTRAASATLAGGALTIAGNATANSSDTITGALTIGAGGNSTVTITPNAARNTLLSAGSFTREAGGTALIRGTSLGANVFGTANSANISFTAPNLVGNGGTGTDRGIFVGVVGDTASGGTGFGATGGLLTQDATNGVRLLSSGEYKNSITDGQTALDNIRLINGGSGTVTTTLNSDTVINSLAFELSGANAANVTVSGTGKLTINSGVIYSNSTNTRSTGSSLNTNVVSNNISFNNREAVILVGGGNGYLNLSGILADTDGKGLTVYAPGRGVTLSGASANTYTGTTTINGGTLTLSKTAGVNAITGNVVINSGGALAQSTANQIADTANITVNSGGTLTLGTETINNLTVNGGSATNAIISAVNVAGVTSLSNGGTIALVRSQHINGNYDSAVTLGGGLNITHKTSGDYTAVTIGHGSGAGQSGGKLVLGGDVTFTGNATNTNTVLIDAIKGSGRQGVIELTSVAGSRTFNIGDGAAATDLRITASLLDGAGGASALVKTGAGSLELTGANTYTGATTVSAGTLSLGSAHRIADTSALVMNGGTFATGGFSETLGSLTVSSSSIIDLGFGASALVFADSSGSAWGGSISLSFVNFTAGVDSIRIGTSSSGLTGLQLGQITLNGLAASIDSSGYLGFSAIPEPSSIALLAGLGGLGLAATRRRHRAA